MRTAVITRVRARGRGCLRGVSPALVLALLLGLAAFPGVAHGRTAQPFTIAARYCPGPDALDPLACGEPIPGVAFLIGNRDNRLVTGPDGVATGDVGAFTPGAIGVHSFAGRYIAIALACVAGGRSLAVRSSDIATATQSFVIDAPADDAIDCAMSFGLVGDVDSGPSTPQIVFAIDCDGDPGLVPAPEDASFPPDGCRPQPGATLVATSGAAEPIDSCVTGDDGLCSLLLPVGPVILEEAATSVPAGYEPIANPVLLRETQAPSGIVNVRSDALSRPTGTASLTVHSRVCPLEYAGDNFFADCHDTMPAYPQTIFLIGEQGGLDARSARIDAAGNVVFAGLAAEAQALIPALPWATARTVVVCSHEDAPGVAVPTTHVTLAWGAKTLIPLDEGESVVCDLYAIPADRVNG